MFLEKFKFIGRDMTVKSNKPIKIRNSSSLKRYEYIES